MASGSNGNCAVLSTEEAAILIDAGISRKRTLAGLKKLRIAPTDVRFVLLTHAHSDHVGGLPVVSDGLPVRLVATPETIDGLRSMWSSDQRYPQIAANAIPVPIGGSIDLGVFSVKSFPTQHDSPGAAAFRVTYYKANLTLTYITDTGELTPEMLASLNDSDIAVIESNYDIGMLARSRRPAMLKARIRKNHMSNVDTLRVIEQIDSERIKVLFMAHLSGECNSPDIVAKGLRELANSLDRTSPWDWVIATRDASSTLVELNERSHKLRGGYSSQSGLAKFFGTG